MWNKARVKQWLSVHLQQDHRPTGASLPTAHTRLWGQYTVCPPPLPVHRYIVSHPIDTYTPHAHGTTITDHPPPAGSPAYIRRAPTTGHTNTPAHDASPGPSHRLRGAVVHCSARLGEPMSEPRPPAPLLSAAPPRSREEPPLLPNRGQPRWCLSARALF